MGVPSLEVGLAEAQAPRTLVAVPARHRPRDRQEEEDYRHSRLRAICGLIVVIGNYSLIKSQIINLDNVDLVFDDYVRHLTRRRPGPAVVSVFPDVWAGLAEVARWVAIQ